MLMPVMVSDGLLIAPSAFGWSALMVAPLWVFAASIWKFSGFVRLWRETMQSEGVFVCAAPEREVVMLLLAFSTPVGSGSGLLSSGCGPVGRKRSAPSESPASFLKNPCGE